MAELVTLAAGNARCIICPDVGGSIAAWTIDGQNMLRDADDFNIASAEPLAMASFPLVPYSNRIDGGRFNWRGEDIRVEPNFPPEPHAIHGVGWKNPWQLSEISPTRCILSLSHGADNHWPWSFAATQEIELSSHELKMTLEAVNMSAEPAPLAFGHHPYFEQSGAYLAFGADQVFLSGGDMLPSDPTTPSGIFDFSKGEPVAGRHIDHCYAGWDGVARIVWENRPFGLVITSSMESAVVYIPDGEDYFCFEPVPHINNALNRPPDGAAMPVIDPGRTYRSTIVMTAGAADTI